MTQPIDTSTLGRIDLASGKSPAPIEECVSSWAVDDLVERLRREASLSRGQGDFVMTRHAYLLTEAADRIQSLIADNKRLREALGALFASYKALADSGDAGNWALEDLPEGANALAALSHKD